MHTNYLNVGINEQKALAGDINILGWKNEFCLVLRRLVHPVTGLFLRLIDSQRVGRGKKKN